MALILGFLSVIAAIAGGVLVICHVLRMVTIVGCALLIMPLIGMVGFSLIVGSIALFAFVQIFGEPYYAGSIAAAGVVTLGCGYFMMQSILTRYKRTAKTIGRFFGKKNEPSEPLSLPEEKR
jgi:hypothetical protein